MFLTNQIFHIKVSFFKRKENEDCKDKALGKAATNKRLEENLKIISETVNQLNLAMVYGQSHALLMGMKIVTAFLKKNVAIYYHCI